MTTPVETRMEKLVLEGYEEAAQAVDATDRLFGGASYGSAAHAKARQEAIRRQFRATTFQLGLLVAHVRTMDQTEKGELLHGLALKLAKMISARVDEDYDGRVLQQKLMDDVDALVIDFPLGIVWGQIVRPEARHTTNIRVENIHGGVQQFAGAGAHQSVVISALPDLLKQIDQIMQHPEIASLSREDRQVIEELADDIKEEASRPQPDGVRIERWGTRMLRRLARGGAAVTTEVLRAALVAAISSAVAL